MELNEELNSVNNFEKQVKDIEEVTKLSQIIVELLFLSMQKDVKKDNIGIIVDDTSMDIKKCNEIYGSPENIIYCLGTSKISPKELERKIREYDTKDDWSNYIPKAFLPIMCENIIKESKKNEIKCKKYKNIKYIDTSQDREKVLNQIIEKLEDII